MNYKVLFIETQLKNKINEQSKKNNKISIAKK